MKHKRFLVLSCLLILFSFFCFADDTYKLSVNSAVDMSVSDNVVVLEGNVNLSFITINGDNDELLTRNLSADRVIINIETNNLDAFGNVVLQEGKDSSFKGDSISLNWDNLDVVVFGGKSTSDRTGTQGNVVTFYIEGNRIAYSGQNEAVFFNNGTIATREIDPYWSINAKKIGLAGSDLFFSNATLKLGRVPVFWFPVFFYPGNRLSFNPSIGFSSYKGAFLNTTYEVYGVYPGIGSSNSSSQKDNDTDATALASSFISFLGDDKKEAQLRSGWTYIPQTEAEDLPTVQKWALDTKSYFAVFADIWENYGLSVGYDTLNHLLDKKLTVNSTGVFAYRNLSPFRFSFNLKADYKLGDANFSLTIPVLSDPDVKSDLLNRNTVFGLDSVFGAKQDFPSTYSSGQNKYSIILNGSASKKVKGYSFNLVSLKSQINYEWESANSKYHMKDAVLPYISFSSSGTIIDIKGEAETKTEDVKYNSNLAQQFYDNYKILKEKSGTGTSYFGEKGLKAAAASPIMDSKTVKADGSLIKLSYNYNQIIDNSYTGKFEHSSWYTKIDSSLNFNANTKGKTVVITDSLKPLFSATIRENTYNSTDFMLSNNLTVKTDFLNFTYTLHNTVYLYENDEKEQINRWGKWEKKDIQSHSLEIGKKFGDFSFGLKYVLPPLVQLLVPKLSYSHAGLSVMSDVSLSAEQGSFFKPDVFHLDLEYKNNTVNATFKNTYDFKKHGSWEGYHSTESVILNYLSGRLKFSQNLSLERQFDINELLLGVDYDKNYLKFSFKGNQLSINQMKIYLCQDIQPVYLWKNRIGLEGSLDVGFNYDFTNKYNSSLYADFRMNFAINKFLDVSITVSSENNSFYRYYQAYGDGDKFSLKALAQDLIYSFDFFGDGRAKTGFTLDKYSVSAVHYMEDWTLSLTSSSQIKTVEGKKKFVPEFTFLLKWNAIPELKSKNTWNSISNWEK